MTEISHQTVRLGKGRHHSPERGACVMELASMLSGEPFSDHPHSVCPVIAGFLRDINDLMPDGEHDELFAYAPLVVGTNGPRRVRRLRARRILEWAGVPLPAPTQMFVRLAPWDLVLLPAAEEALRLPRERRQEELPRLLDELAAMGADGGDPGNGQHGTPMAPPRSVEGNGRSDPDAALAHPSAAR